MSEEDEGTGAEPAEDPVWERDTAPQSPYTPRDVAVGIVVMAVGAVVTFGLPLALLGV